MSEFTIWHNPRCSKSRQALAILQDAGVSPTIRLYLTDPPTVDELRGMQELLRVPVLSMMRPREKAFAEAGLDKTSTDAALLAAMAAHPILIERPLVIRGTRAVLGRPPEKIRALL